MILSTLMQPIVRTASARMSGLGSRASCQPHAQVSPLTWIALKAGRRAGCIAGCQSSVHDWAPCKLVCRNSLHIIVACCSQVCMCCSYSSCPRQQPAGTVMGEGPALTKVLTPMMARSGCVLA